MQNNPFGNISNEGLEPARDSLGGGVVFESDVYDGTIKMAYYGTSQGGAKFLAIQVQIGDREYRETMYVTNKNGDNFWQKDGKKNPLPGFTTANDLALMSTGYGLSDNELGWEEKVVQLWDRDAQSEIPKKVLVATEMLGKPISLAIMKQIEDKTKLNEQTNQYDPTGETRETNTIDKVFHNESGKTLSEFLGKKPAEFQEKWRNKNKGGVRDKSKGLAGKSGAPGRSGAPSSSNAGGGAAKKGSLFG